LKAISQGYESASSIAKELRISITFAAQQLKLLEAYNFIQRKKIRTKKIGKPAALYEISKQSTALCHIGSDAVFFHSIKGSKSNNFLINAAHLETYNTNYFLYKMYFLHEDILLKSEYVSLLEMSKQKIQVFIITENVEKIRKELSTIHLESNDGTKMDTALWSHTMEEVVQGLQKKEKYFLEKLDKSITLLDNNNTLKKLKNKGSLES
jgi:hypothetical protein